MLTAEGGTEYGHRSCIYRSKSPYGPYEGCPHNPIISQPPESSVQAAGHADLFCDQFGSWFAVCLGVRPISHQQHLLGRETFLAPVSWQDGWPVVNGGAPLGLVMDAPLPGVPAKGAPTTQSAQSAQTAQSAVGSLCERFDGDGWNLAFNHIRNPRRENYVQNKAAGCLTLTGGDPLSRPLGHPTFLGVRQKAVETSLVCELGGEIADGGFCGITAYAHPQHHYDIGLSKEGGRYYVCLRKSLYDNQFICCRTQVEYGGRLLLKIDGSKKQYSFSYCTSPADEKFILLGEGAATALCKEVICDMMFTGAYLGMFAEGTSASFYRFHMTWCG